MKFREFKKELEKEEAPANSAGSGNIAGIGVGPDGEPGVKKKKKKDVVMGTLKRKVTENNDNNNVILRQILENLDNVDNLIDNNNAKVEIKIEEPKVKKSFKERYNVK